ncbi:MAG: hypothetical protein ACREDS_06570 [Limisphaerales bacterium]
MIDIPEYGWDGKISTQRILENRDPDHDHFYVVIENVSSKPVFLSEVNGEIHGLSFEITTDDGKKIMVHRGVQTREKTTFRELAIPPGQVSVREIYYGLDWGPFPFPKKPHTGSRPGKVTVTIRAAFEEKPPKSVTEMDYWSGRAVSEPYTVVLEDNIF